MSYYAPGWPGVYTALRGLCYAEISVRTLERDLHSGTYGGVAPNAIETLVRILGDLKSRTGEIRIPGLYEAVTPPSRDELDTWNRLPFDREEFLRDEVTGKKLTGLENRSVFERVWALPTFEIHGIKGGFIGEGAKTVIPAQATAKVSLRLVPGQSFEQVGSALTRAVAAAAPEWAEVTVNLLHGGDPVQVDVDAPAFAVLDQAFEEVVGRKAVRVRAGGSIPIVPELGLAGAPVVLTGIGLPDDGLHSPNEKLDLAQLWNGIQIFGRFFELFAQKGVRRANEEPGEKAAAEGRLASPGWRKQRLSRSERLQLLLVGVHPLHRAGIALGPGVELVHPDERTRRGDDSCDHIVRPVGIRPLPRGQPGGAFLQVPDSRGAPLVLGRGDYRPRPGRAELHFFQSLQV